MVNSTTENTGVLLSDGTRLTQQNVPIATTTQVGVVKPDGVSIHVDAAGTINSIQDKTGYDTIYVQSPVIGAGTPGDPLTIKLSSDFAITDKTISVSRDIGDLANYYTKKQIDDTFAKKSDIPSTLSVPIATTEMIGGVIVGDGLKISSNGLLSADVPPELIKTPITTDITSIDGNKKIVSVPGLNIPLGVVTSNNHFVAVNRDDYTVVNTVEEQSTKICINRAIVLDNNDKVDSNWYILSYKV